MCPPMSSSTTWDRPISVPTVAAVWASMPWVWISAGTTQVAVAETANMSPKMASAAM
ncbi:hypothetical protein D9M70_584010 [compost metagenome]